MNALQTFHALTDIGARHGRRYAQHGTCPLETIAEPAGRHGRKERLDAMGHFVEYPTHSHESVDRCTA
eukprot:scaffold15682_cov84-Amphora_coffeaeformis.AAC.2